LVILPLYSTLKETEVDYIISTVKELLAKEEEILLRTKNSYIC